jgi:hypothetical protein
VGRKEGGREKQSGFEIESLIPLLLISSGSLHSILIIDCKHFKTCLFRNADLVQLSFPFIPNLHFKYKHVLRCLKTTNLYSF